MSITLQEVFTRARYTLHDAASVRWPLPELLDYANDGVREMALHKPTIFTDHVELPLQRGVWQVIPGTYHHLVSITRNLASLDATVAGRQGGRAVLALPSFQALENLIPSWSSPGVTAESKEIDSFVRDIRDPRAFHVYPPNDGTGLVEAIVAVTPADLDAPETPDDIASYEALEVGISRIYLNALTDYVLYRCYAKDANMPGSAQRAASHRQLFDAALGVAQQREIASAGGADAPPQGG